jgi:hypothetical protein
VRHVGEGKAQQWINLLQFLGRTAYTVEQSSVSSLTRKLSCYQKHFKLSGLDAKYSVTLRHCPLSQCKGWPACRQRDLGPTGIAMKGTEGRGEIHIYDVIYPQNPI